MVKATRALTMIFSGLKTVALNLVGEELKDGGEE